MGGVRLTDSYPALAVMDTNCTNGREPLLSQRQRPLIFMQGPLNTRQCCKDRGQCQRSQYYERGSTSAINTGDTGYRAVKEHAQV